MKRISTLLILAAILCANSSAQKRFTGKEIKWDIFFEPAHVTKLVYYGTYQAGIEVNRLYPSGKNSDEQFFFGEDDGVKLVVQKGCLDGTKVYVATIDKDMVFISNAENENDVNWLRLEYVDITANEEIYLYTVDKLGTYRYLKIITLEEAGIQQ